MGEVNLDEYLVPGTSSTYYIPDFVTEDEEEYLIRKIEEAPQPWWKRLNNRRSTSPGGDLTKKQTLIPQDMPVFVNQYPDILGRIRDLGVFKASAHGQPNHVIMNEYAPGQGIMPHEDGPAYHPVVATLSLGAHTIFHYYQYKQDDPSSRPTPSSPASASGADTGMMGASSATGRPIDPTPILTLLLEPRSLVITTSSLYQSHLHGIDDLMEDSFAPASRSPGEKIANVHLLRGKAEKDAVLNGGFLERGLRYSLTCRDVEKVTAAGGALFKKLRG
ncbi:hypothetical protein K466DRAFT_483807 [Polyporus arcularius HHB13444]|uniref:Fe2OG dioxygenase domain-containing protein n=1 Tax=Polyporus arcularius HHB13444 TaxID=1314778 RepID=A0A5C3PPB8_9APHY|nr:hypothetical protein K466DRAFT_483807 [Polyporus arcularius HHB13444]